VTDRAYPVAGAVSPQIHAHFSSHITAAHERGHARLASVPDAAAIEAMIDVAFWASLRREEIYIPKISLAFLAPDQTDHPLVLEHPLPLDAAALTRVAPAVERPGIHLGVARVDGELRVWGTARMIPTYCFVAEVVEPGLIVVKHHRGDERVKFVNVAVLEGDRIKIVDERASAIPDCPTLLTSLLGIEVPDSWSAPVNVLVRLAVSMRAHRRGGLLIIVPAGSESWRDSIVRPISYAVDPAFGELTSLRREVPGRAELNEWFDRIDRAVEAIAGLTAVDGATLLTADYEVLAFGAKITRRRPAHRRAAHRHRARGRRRAARRAPVVARRHASPVGGAVRLRPARRGGPGGVAGRPLHGVRVVLLRRHGARPPRGGAAAVDGPAAPYRSILTAAAGSHPAGSASSCGATLPR